MVEIAPGTLRTLPSVESSNRPNILEMGTLVYFPRKGGPLYSSTPSTFRHELLERFVLHGGHMVFVWPGRWSSDAFEVSVEDARAYLKPEITKELNGIIAELKMMKEEEERR